MPTLTLPLPATAAAAIGDKSGAADGDERASGDAAGAIDADVGDGPASAISTMSTIKSPIGIRRHSHVMAFTAHVNVPTIAPAIKNTSNAVLDASLRVKSALLPTPPHSSEATVCDTSVEKMMRFEVITVVAGALANASLTAPACRPMAAPSSSVTQSTLIESILVSGNCIA